MPAQGRDTGAKDTGAKDTGAVVAEVAARDSLAVRLPCLGQVNLPPPAHLAYYGGVLVMAAAEIVEWPVALLLAVGKALADNRHSAGLRDLGQAMEQA